MRSLIFKIGKFVLVVGTFCLFFACKPNSEYQQEGAEFLQGTWIQETVPYQDSLLQFQLHRFRFTCDSVYVTMRQYAKVRRIPEECFNNGSWEEYAKGVYIIRNDSLLVEATYTHPDGRQKLSGCHTIGQYLARFKIIEQGADSLRLMERYSHIPIALGKTTSSTCIPKKVY